MLSLHCGGMVCRFYETPACFHLQVQVTKYQSCFSIYSFGPQSSEEFCSLIGGLVANFGADRSISRASVFDFHQKEVAK
jgi:hypothetical protein